MKKTVKSNSFTLMILIMFTINMIFTNKATGSTPVPITINEILFTDSELVDSISIEGYPEQYDNKLSKTFRYYYWVLNNYQVKLDITSDYNDDVYLSISAKASGSGFGDLYFTDCNYELPYSEGEYITFNLNPSIPQYVDIRKFEWEWTIIAIPRSSSSYCTSITTKTTKHNAYFIFDEPVAPMSNPNAEVLNYACEWAKGNNSQSDICDDILSNGFAVHYTWNFNCHRLSSNFVRLVSSLGINASLHKWSSIENSPDFGDMIGQLTTSINPVGPTYGQGTREFIFHQWAETEITDLQADTTIQRDPTVAGSFEGTWGEYEQDIFTDYLVKESGYPGGKYYENEEGQESGCEDPDHRVYEKYPSDDILHDWFEPNR